MRISSLASSQRMVTAAAAAGWRCGSGMRATLSPVPRNAHVRAHGTGGECALRAANSRDGPVIRRRAVKPARWACFHAAAAVGPDCDRAPDRATAATHLRELHIKDFALVRDQRVRFHPGLNIITGQSGSGKSVLLEAIAQLCGAPAREEGIRAGADAAVLRAEFQVGEDKRAAVAAILERYGGPEAAVFPTAWDTDDSSGGFSFDSSRQLSASQPISSGSGRGGRDLNVAAQETSAETEVSGTS
uniref:DNA repair protein RecN n=1 Tax=Mantoniella antarctica TaxID=81844 RepID=A0A7S0SLY9_9CHLO|mmetsp:Transcript_30361/g.75959  ORF Transcript_30361/g.75959 Transcript_30361/m.75959 type:complete len:245 (+) Transcript_30361:170-904(+)